MHSLLFLRIYALCGFAVHAFLRHTCAARNIRILSLRSFRLCMRKGRDQKSKREKEYQHWREKHAREVLCPHRDTSWPYASHKEGGNQCVCRTTPTSYSTFLSENMSMLLLCNLFLLRESERREM